MVQGIVSTRLSPPVEVTSLLLRKRLLDLCRELFRYRLTVLQAPAGYGKSSLLCQWHQILRSEGVEAGWLSIDSGGLNPVDFFASVAGAIGVARPALQPQVATLIQSRRHQSPDSLLTALVNLVASSKNHLLIFIDDLHFLPQDSIGYLARFLELAPLEFRLIVATRQSANLGIAKARANGQLLEVGMEALRFTDHETRAYMDSVGCRAEAQAISLLAERADGWITAIKLAGLAMRGELDPTPLLLAFSGSNRDVSDYFAEQVLSTQCEDTQKFLLVTSVLEQFCAEQCNYVLQRSDSRRQLDAIETAGLFLIGLDRERSWYRYHPFFREYLLRHREDCGFTDESKLLLRAAQWLRDKGLFEAAIKTAIAADEQDFAGSILESCSLDWSFRGRISMVTQFIHQIPEAVISGCPNILLTWSWHLIRHLQFEDAQKALTRIREILEAKKDRAPDDEDLIALRQNLLHREMTLAAAQDDAFLVEEKCMDLLNSYGDELHPYLKGSVYSQLLYSRRDQFRMKDVDKLAAKARGVLERSQFRFALLAVFSVIGYSLHLLGKTDAAIQSLEDGIKVAVAFGGERSALVALPSLPLSAILYEKNELEKAEEVLARNMENANEWGFADQFVSAYITQIRILDLHNEADEAFQVLHEGMALALDRHLERLRLALVAEKIRLLVRSSGLQSEIVNTALGAGIPDDQEAVVPTARSRSRDESMALAWVYRAQATDNIPGALFVARKWQRFCEKVDAKLSLVRWTILLAELHLLQGELAAAQRTIREALVLAEPAGMVRSFLDGGARVQTLVEYCCQFEGESNNPADSYAKKLLAAFGGKLPEVQLHSRELISGYLKDREIAVLQLVGSGMRNREIADNMGMTEGSIKWYMQQIFDKLGTRSRVQAVNRARRLGLIT